MKKKLLAFAIVAALVAVLAIPMAVSAASPLPTTTTVAVGGADAGSTVVLVAPSGITLGTADTAFTAGDTVYLQPGWNTGTATPGSVTVLGSTGVDPWTVTAVGSFGMTGTPSGTLGDPLLIGTSTASGAKWYFADGGTGADPSSVDSVTPSTATLTYNGSTAATINFAAAQFMGANDANAPAGSYQDTITFTLSSTY
jgi:hypothetical protein